MLTQMPPLTDSQLSIRRLFAIVAAWAIAFTWPQWMDARYNSWGNVIWWALFTLSVGLPLSLLVIGGRPMIPWLVAGGFAACLIATWYLYSEFRRRTGVPYGTLAVVIAGLGAGTAGSSRACYRHRLARRWLRATAWALTALTCSALFAWFVWLLRKL
jgi:hypothetical protein